MRTVFILFFLFTCRLCSAGESANVIVMSEWSKPVSLRNDQLHDIAIRGRLVIVQGMETAYGGPPTTNGAMTFVELQNIGLEGIDLYFSVTNLHCELSDATGKAVPKPPDVAWGGRGPFLPYWVTLPYNSTLRLFINGGRLDPLSLYPSGEPWCYWSIPRSDTNAYYLTGTLNLSTHTNLSLLPEFREMDYKQNGTATLEFPKVGIQTGRAINDSSK
jgi:hypothetical protein